VAAGNSALVVQPSPSTDFTVEARIEVIALERPDGSFSSNLLPAGGTAVLMSPRTGQNGLALTGLPPGVYVAARLALGEDGVVAIDANGQRQAVTLPSRELRATFEAPATVAGQRWLLLEPNPPAPLARGSGGLEWAPVLRARIEGEQAVEGVVTVVAVHAQEHAFDAVADDLGGLRIRVQVPPGCDLGDSGGSRSRDEFFAGLGADDRVAVCAVLTDLATMVLSCGHRHDRRSGVRHHAFGTIVELDPAQQAFVMQVREVDAGASISRVFPRPRLRVLAGSARIHRSGYRNIHLDFGALATGMQVEVEWHGEIAQDTVTAHEVEIEDEPGHRHEIEGAIGEVRVAENLLVVVPRGDDPLVVGGRSVPSAEVVILPHTVLFGPDNANRHTLTLGDLRPGQRVWVFGRVVGEQRVEALSVRVRNDGRGRER